MPGLLVPLALGHDAQFVTSALLPVVLLAAYAVVAAGGTAATLAATLALALALGIQVLTGHPQVVIYSSMFLVAYVLVLALVTERPARLVWVGGAVLLGMLVSAAVWWPALLYSAHSMRGGQGDGGISMEEVARFSMAWRELPSLVWAQAVGGVGATYWGNLAGAHYPRFLGATVVTLAVAGWVASRGWRNGMASLLAASVLLTVALTLGTHLGPLYEILHRGIPFWSKFRTPSMALVVAQLSLALLAARALTPQTEAVAGPGARSGPPGAEAGARGKGGMSRQTPSPPGCGSLPGGHGSLWVVVGLCVLAGLAGIALAKGWLAPAYAQLARSVRPAMVEAAALGAAQTAGWDLIARVALVGALIATLVLVARRRLPVWLAGGMLVIVVVLDLGSVTMPILRSWTGPVARIEAAPRPELARLGAAEPSARVSSTRRVPADPTRELVSSRDIEFYSNDWIRWRARALGGNHGALPAYWWDLAEATRNYNAMCALGVVYMSGDPGPPWDSTLFARVSERPDEVVYRLRRALGRAYAVRFVRALGNDAAVGGMLASGRFDPAREAYTSDLAAVGDYPGSPGTVLRWLEDGPDHLVIDVEAPGPAFVVVADSWFPGWTATLDGRPTEIHRVDLILRGVRVPPGRHRLEMRYVPEGWRLGAGATRAGLGLWSLAALAAVGWWMRERGRGRSRPPGSPRPQEPGSSDRPRVSGNASTVARTNR
jgi:hypothetical protein